MKTLHVFAVMFTSIVLAGCLYATEPPTITLNVPVHLTNIHQDVQAVIIAGSAYDGSNIKVGYCEQTLFSASGDYNVTQPMIITQVSGKNITSAVRYECELLLQVNGSKVSPGHQTSPPPPANVAVKAGTPFTGEVSGAVNW